MYAQKLSFRDKLAKNYINAIGWNTKRKLVLIESDDWGTVRTASRKAYENILSETGKAGCYFDKYDAIESGKDLEMLFEVLSSVKDKNGNHAIMSPISVVANPDFDAVEKNGFSEYVNETVLDTYKRFPITENSFEVAQEGIRSGVWFPQFHGREHINAKRWFKALQMDDPLSKTAFIHHSLHSGCMPSSLDYFNAFDIDGIDDIDWLKDVMQEGLSLFERIWGYKAMAFCAPCGVIRTEIIDVAANNGIKLFAGQYFLPNGLGGHKKIDKKWGDKTKSESLYYRRNCKFEPSKNYNIDWVDRCLNDIAIAFRWGKPANIDSHRVNFIGSIYEENRDFTLKELKRLLKEIVKCWSDVEFVNSKQLYNEMTKSKQS